MSHVIDSPLTLMEYNNGWDTSLGLAKWLAYNEAYSYSQFRSWSVADDTDLTTLRAVSRFFADNTYASALIARETEMSWVHYDGTGALSVYVAARDQARTEEMVAEWLAHFPVVTEGKDEHQIPLWLWNYSPQGPKKLRRMIDVPTWAEIRENYSQAVVSQLDPLMQARPTNGRFILFSGVPGTGKTFCIRALGSEWRRFCSLHYVVDPDALFGGHPDYLMTLLLDDQDTLELIEGNAQGRVRPQETWRLIILEDTGEMLSVDAKHEVGQAVSRLLNVTDGMLGQGMRLMILVSTNEEVGRLNPAISRSGRCAAQIRFDPLSAAESLAWLASHGVEGHIGSTTTLADLYAMLNGQTQPLPRQEAGFLLGKKSH